VKYHEEFEKKIKGSKIEVVDDPESRRLKRLGSLVSQVEYKRTTDTDARRSSLTYSGVFPLAYLLDSALQLEWLCESLSACD